MNVQYEAPHVNGVLELIESKKTTLRNQLNTILTDFIPTYEQPVADTFYLVVAHTKKHGSQSTFTQLNGDTVEHLLSTTEIVEPPVKG